MSHSRILPFLFLLLLSAPAFAGSIFDLLYSGNDDAVAIRLVLPMDSAFAKLNTDQDARLSFTDVNGQAQNWGLKTSVRGKFRRQRCDYPPLKLNFGKKDLRAAGLEDWDKYKLVSTCSADPLASQLVLKEYLAYRVYNQLTENSFRVQRVLITYVDSNGKYPKRVEEGFLIEDNDEMAARIGGERLKEALGQPVDAYDAEAEATQALVQYLISNGDWSMYMVRNLKVVRRAADGKLIPIGYDFDFSGFVGAPYASPTSEIGQQSIYQRIYQGYVHPDSAMRSVAQQFKDKRREVMSLIGKASYLSLDERELLQRFVSRFFRELNQKANNDALPLYDQLRGAISGFIPPGAGAARFQTMGK